MTRSKSSFVVRPLTNGQLHNIGAQSAARFKLGPSGRFGSRLCENSHVEHARRNFLSITSNRKRTTLAVTVERRKGRKQFCAFSARAFSHSLGHKLISVAYPARPLKGRKRMWPIARRLRFWQGTRRADGRQPPDAPRRKASGPQWLTQIDESSPELNPVKVRADCG